MAPCSRRWQVSAPVRVPPLSGSGIAKTAPVLVLSAARVNVGQRRWAAARSASRQGPCCRSASTPGPSPRSYCSASSWVASAPLDSSVVVLRRPPTSVAAIPSICSASAHQQPHGASRPSRRQLGSSAISSVILELAMVVPCVSRCGL